MPNRDGVPSTTRMNPVQYFRSEQQSAAQALLVKADAKFAWIILRQQPLRLLKVPASHLGNMREIGQPVERFRNRLRNDIKNGAGASQYVRRLTGLPV